MALFLYSGKRFAAGALAVDHGGPADLLVLWFVALLGTGLFSQYLIDVEGESPFGGAVPVLVGGVIVLAAWTLDPPGMWTPSSGLPSRLFWSQEARHSCHVRESRAEWARIAAVPDHFIGVSRCDLGWDTLVDLLPRGLLP